MQEAAACPTDEQLEALATGRLSGVAQAELQAHLDGCPDCRSLVSVLVAEGPVSLAATWSPSGPVPQADPGPAPPGPLPPPTLAPPALAPGSQPPDELDEYRLVRPLGRGAMGQVYLAQDTLLDRLVAIKWIAQVAPDAAARSRFLIEARAIARLQHPNVVSIYRVGQWSGRRYLVSEYVSGRSLDQVPRPMAGAEVARVALGLSRGLSAAHRRGVLHRDLKPANVMLAEDGEVKLLDFGLAKLVLPGPGPGLPWSQVDASAVASTMVSAGQKTPPPVSAPPVPEGTQVVGTPRYMAPEIWRGEPAQAQSDLYSLGALLFELATGVPPHPERDMNRLRHAVLHRDAPAVRAVAPQAAPLDARLCAVIDRCLRRDPAERFASVDELLPALLPLQAPDPAQPADEVGASAVAPYRGLSSFEAEHRRLFLGRSAEIREVLELLVQKSLVVVAGDSGVGKSSLCRAGVLPRCGDALPGGRAWATPHLLPGRRPVAALLSALRSVAPGVAVTAEDVAADPARAVTAILGELPDETGVVLFCDQAEELFTQADEAEALAFGLAVQALCRSLRVRVLLTVRGDFLTRLVALPGIDTEISGGLYVLRPLTAEGLREIIIGPARQRGVAFESDDLVQELVHSTLRQEGGLPLLEFTLLELWALRDPARQVIPTLALRALGGVSGALSRHADGVLQALLPEDRGLARRLMLRLLSPEGLRLRRSEADLLPVPDGAERWRKVLEHLLRGRLLVAREGSAGGTYEIAHEALCAGWARLHEWLQQERERLVVLERLELQAREWRRLQRSPEALWGGRQVAEAAVLQAGEDELPPVEREFLRASRRAARLKRLRQLGAGPLVLLLIGGAWGGVLLQKQRVLDRLIDSRADEARERLRRTRAQAEALAETRRQAFAAFNQGDTERGEALWAQVQQTEGSVTSTYGQASKAVETALSLDRHRAALRRLFAEVLFERALLAEAQRAELHKDDLLERLATYDDSGELRRRWAAPATLTVEVTGAGPGPLQVRAARVVPDPQGRRVAQAPQDLGVAPVRGAQLPAGTYVLLLQPGGDAAREVRAPVRLSRGEELTLRLPLPRRVPAGYVAVPPGRFLYGTQADESARQSFLRAEPQHLTETRGYVIARSETTYADWIAYLRALPPAERAARLPRAGTSGLHGHLALREEDGGYGLLLQPGPRAYHAGPGDPLRYAGPPDGRDRRTVQDWQRFPVTGVSCADARAYARWLSDTGRVPGARLCTEKEWERAARGADDREYPHGDRLLPDDANYDRTYGKRPLAFGPDEVGSHQASDSPFGVQDLTGNAFELVQAGAGTSERCVVRGGAYYYGELTGRVTNRTETEPDGRDPRLGLRVCAAYEE